MDAELSYKEKYERMSVFYFLKNGKPLIRRGLFNRILFLCLGIRKYFIIKSSVLENEKYDRSYLIKVTLDDQQLQKLKLGCNFYLGDFDIQKEKSYDFFGYRSDCIKICYKKENVRWDLLDRDLILLYPDNVTIKNNIPKIKNYRHAKHVNPDHIFDSIDVSKIGEKNSSDFRTKN
jgi:hypothetical protein